MDAFITAAALRQSLGSGQPPLVIDVRRQPAFLGAPDMVRGALRRDPGKVDLWKDTLPAGREVVVYCVHGHEVSQNAAKALGARFLEGGIEAWRTAGGELSRKPAGASSRWITRERPKIDRVACPWLIRRFIDPSAEFLFVPVADVRRIGSEREAVAYDIPEVKFSHEGERCSFDLAAQSAGLLAVSLGLSRLYKDDHEMLEHGMVVYDALYAWCKGGKEETHTWNPTAYK
jgi:rhodanese-related sulfurtransferase